MGYSAPGGSKGGAEELAEKLGMPLEKVRKVLKIAKEPLSLETPIGDEEDPLNDQRRCPLCGVPMFLSRIEPAHKVDHDQRTFECSACDYSETVTVKFR